MEFWENLDDANDGFEDTDWEEIHTRNYFKCSIDTRLRSFYFKIFIKQLPLMTFCLKLIVKIPQTVLFVMKSLNP